MYLATADKFIQMLSMEKLTFCCYWCGYGCQVGYLIKTWSHFKIHGVVTGNNNSNFNQVKHKINEYTQ